MTFLDTEVSPEVKQATKDAIKQTLNTIEDKMGAVFLWSAVAVVGLILLGALFVWLFRREIIKTYFKAALVFSAGLAVAIAVCGLGVQLIKYDVRGYLVPTMLYPLVATGATALLGAFALALVGAIDRSKLRLALWIVIGITCVPLIVTLVYMGRYYAANYASDGYYNSADGTVKVSTLALVLSCVGLAVLAGLVAIFCGKKGDKSEHTRTIAYAGVSVALAFALSYIKLFRMPQGGSVTLASMLPIMLFSCRYGTRKGLLVGFIYGMLQAIQDPYVIHPAQFLLDYPFAFAMLGLAGWAGEIRLFGRHRWASLLVGCVSAFFLRYIAHTLSGIFAFAAYAADAGAASATVYSFAYNSYVLIDGAICMALGIMMYINRGARRTIFGLGPVGKVGVTKEEAEAAEQQASRQNEQPDLENVDFSAESDGQVVESNAGEVPVTETEAGETL